MFVALVALFLMTSASALQSAAQSAVPRLLFTPAGASAGTVVTARTASLTPATAFDLVWHTGRAGWEVHDGKFLGIRAPDTSRVLASGTSDASGVLHLRFPVPEDFGYIHDVELRAADGAVVAHQGFTVIPHLTVAPVSGPLGTPITITMTGVGYRFYQAVWHLMYDGAQTGWLSAITTHGTARVTIPAAGALGMHTLQALEGPTAPYLNEQQSPNYQPLIPTVLAARFRVVPGPVRIPSDVAAQSLPRERAAASAGGGATPALASDFRSGVVGSAFTLSGRGFAPRTPVTLQWETIVGNRISGAGWETQLRPLGRVATNAGGAFSARVVTPDDVGGDHRIVAQQVGQTTGEAATTYTLTPSIKAVAPARVQAGEQITVRLKGVGWTETGNIYTVVVDNAFFGYGCGFNSRGDVTMRIQAPGASGWHFVELYPAIYKGQILGPGLPPQGADVNGSYFLLPMLNVVDHPGERLPAFHLAVLVD